LEINQGWQDTNILHTIKKKGGKGNWIGHSFCRNHLKHVIEGKSG